MLKLIGYAVDYMIRQFYKKCLYKNEMHAFSVKFHVNCVGKCHTKVCLWLFTLFA